MAKCRACKFHDAKPGFAMCEKCRRYLIGRNAHAEVDAHVDACRFCKSAHSICTEGSRLNAVAISLDGRLDEEYAKEFGRHDPVTWYLIHGQEEMV